MGATTRSKPSREIGEFVSGLTFEDVPDESVHLIENVTLDTVGVTLAGTTEGGAAETAAQAIAALPGDDGETRLIGRDQTAPLLEAAFVNGTASHCLDYDDMAVPAIHGHPSVVMVPAILAIADAERVTGREAVTAYAAGFEVMTYIGRTVLPEHYSAGWHATGTLGTFGAAAAAASLLDLDADDCVTTVSIAASMAAGLRQNFGTMVKPMHAGQAVRSGLTAAYLAEHGFTASETAIKGEDGFIDAYSGAAAPDRSAFFELGEEWALTRYGIDTKRYPCCGATHTSIAAAQRLVEEHGIEPADVESVHVESTPTAGEALLYDDPETGFQGKFSMQYAVASAIVRDAVGIAAFDDENVDDPAVQAIRERVTFVVNDDLPHDSLEGTVTIETHDGDTDTAHVRHPPGSFENPMTDAEYREKLIACATHAIDRERSEAAADFLQDLRDRDDLADVFDYV